MATRFIILIAFRIVLLQIGAAVITDLDRSLLHLEQDDPKLIEAIRKHYLVPPPAVKVQPDIEVYIPGMQGRIIAPLRAQVNQPLVVDDIFYRMLGKSDAGFFVEAGAHDGAYLSNTLYLELKRNWTGLLIEPNPDSFAVLKKRKRNAWLLNSCLASQNRPEIVSFDLSGLVGGIINPDEPQLPGAVNGVDAYFDQFQVKRRVEELLCLPLSSIIAAMGNPHIDYFSLDVEGVELPVLRSLPPNYQLNVTLLGVEITEIGRAFPGSLHELRSFLSDRGFQVWQRVAYDDFYLKRSSLQQSMVIQRPGCQATVHKVPTELE